MYITGDWPASVPEKLLSLLDGISLWHRSQSGSTDSAAAAARHDLPPQPGRQWHSPLDAWQPSAWTQLHLLRQSGPNVPTCMCEKRPRRRGVVRGPRLTDAHSGKTGPPATRSCWDSDSFIHWVAHRRNLPLMSARLGWNTWLLQTVLVSVSLIYKSSFVGTAQLDTEFVTWHPLCRFSEWCELCEVWRCVSCPKDYSAVTRGKQ